MNEARRLSAWLRANAKHMKFEDERMEMIRAAKMIDVLEDDRAASLDALVLATKTLAEVKGLISELPKQEALGNYPRIPLPTVRD